VLLTLQTGETRGYKRSMSARAMITLPVIDRIDCQENGKVQ
jgi:hypothetical protein